jgi:CrcB protein
MHWTAYFFQNPLVLVAFGGAMGSCCRYQAGLWLQSASQQLQLPLATTLVNCLGSLLLGLVAGFFATDKTNPIFLLLGVGFCGGFTTFSTLSLELVEHIQNGRPEIALGESLVNLITGCLLFYAGVCLTQST